MNWGWLDWVAVALLGGIGGTSELISSASGRSAAGSRISSHGTSASATSVSISIRVSARRSLTLATRPYVAALQDEPEQLASHFAYALLDAPGDFRCGFYRVDPVILQIPADILRFLGS